MFFHLTLTTECNLKCKYCFGEVVKDFEEDFGDLDIEYSLPKTTNYDYKILKRILQQRSKLHFNFL